MSFTLLGVSRWCIRALFLCTAALIPNALLPCCSDTTLILNFHELALCRDENASNSIFRYSASLEVCCTQTMAVYCKWSRLTSLSNATIVKPCAHSSLCINSALLFYNVPFASITQISTAASTLSNSAPIGYVAHALFMGRILIILGSSLAVQVTADRDR